MFDKLVRYILYFLILFVPLENVFLSNITFPLAYIFISQITDLIVLSLLAIILIEKSLTEKKLQLVGGGFDILLIVFLFIAYISGVAHSAGLIEISLNIKVLLRYLILIYIILNLKHNDRFFQNVIQLFFLSIVFQQVVALLQLTFGMPFYKLFMGASDWIEVGGRAIYNTNFQDAEKGWLIGTQARSIQFALINLLGFVFYQIHHKGKKGLRFWIVSGVYIFFLIMSGSRSVFLVAIISLLTINIYQRGIARWLVYTFILSPFLLIGILALFLYLPDNYILHIFTKEYIKEASNQRLGVLLIMVPAFFKANFIDILIGFTPDKDVLFQYFLKFPNRPNLLRSKADTIEDVYWVAFVYYYGLAGFTAFALYLLGIYNKLKANFKNMSSNNLNKWILLGLVLIIQIIFLSFFNQVFEVKQYSFFFWLFIAIALRQTLEIKKL